MGIKTVNEKGVETLVNGVYMVMYWRLVRSGCWNLDW